MQTIYTMGFTQKSAEQFFMLIMKYNIDLLIDVRLNNQSQLAAFTKGKDLEFFLKTICKCGYSHELSFAPTKELLNDYKKGVIDWNGYVTVFQQLIEKRKMAEIFERKYKEFDRVLLLCSEPTPECCHRRLVAEAVQTKYGYPVVHL